MTDKVALRAIRNGDETALSSLIDRYAAYVGTVIYNIIGESMTREDIEESTSDVFLTLWMNADKPQSNKVKEWLGAVARNKAKNKLREIRGSLPLDEDYICEVPESPETTVTENEERQLVYQAVKNMKQPDREIFLRHYYGIQPIKQISMDMGMSESAIKVRLSRGREKLRNSLAERRQKNEK
jgi:RNA polymerase sigma-70 factor (ECF subfamily)